MEAGQLSAVLGVILVRVEMTTQDLDLQKEPEEEAFPVRRPRLQALVSSPMLLCPSSFFAGSVSAPGPGARSNHHCPWRPVPEDRRQQGWFSLGTGIQPCGNGRQIAGFWREVGVASSQNLALQTPKRLEALFLTLSWEELTVKAAYNSSGSCETEQIVSSEVNVSGKFVFPGHREIQVIDTDYEQYAILRVSLRWRDKEFHVLKYFTRSLEGEYEPGFWKFRELTADTGLYLVARHGRCAKLLKEELI
ncbi:epididymal-specific lipocalin-8 [Physeter macrocephalus]|uniref:Epididymal-specific lipocalin-8 n=1 Tax=Physeter macrocephalus TaxID=9755 RepID=A0A455C9D5_PHYMC|nr:epididymal-specific lipocalin-8 [Physeter catodon]|eukprot:XP_028353166.1 epididymal-specific lipocalin-8 [Physeter catodon]